MMSTQSRFFVVLLVCILVLLVDVSVCDKGGQGDKNGGGGGGDNGGRGGHNGGGGDNNGRGSRTCTSQKVEDTVRNIIETEVKAKPKLAAKLIRLQFHDCFVRGCDGSVLLNSTQNNTAEKAAVPNLTLEGFDVIDKIKSALEALCPKTVSCADILALATREAVSLPFKVPLWKVLTGRKDGIVSLASEADRLIPSPFSNFPTLLKQFADKNLNSTDLVVLLGAAHTIGQTHCFLIGSRLYNFTGKGDPDPSLDKGYATTLKGLCPNATSRSAIDMDPGSALTFDTHYFKMITQNKAIFTSDASLLTDQRSAQLVRKLDQNRTLFFQLFRNSMEKLIALQDPTAKGGEIRVNCHFVNNP